MPRLALALLAATALAAATTQAATTPVDLSSRSAAAAEPPANLALDRIDQRGLPLDGQFTYPDSAGEGVTIYVVDTGVRFSHNDFAGRAVSGPDFVDGDDDASDCNGDGTALASIAAGASYGVAKKATVVSVRALDCDGSGTTADLVQAIDWVAQDAAGKPAVALLGWGGSASDAVDQAVTNAVASGVTVAVPAGGSGTDACQFSPARVPGALTVGGTVTDTDERADRSNTGGCLDLFAPSTDATAASYQDDTSATPWSGTSTAAALTAGAAALYLGLHPDADPSTVAEELTANATPDVVKNPGEGSPNLLLYTAFMND